jgi:hypothetical protein
MSTDLPPSPSGNPLNLALALAAAAAGGALGWFLFGVLLRQGFYALALPGVLLGLGAGAVARRRSLPLAAVCGVAALALGIFTEWQHLPFVADGSLGYFLAHLHQLRGLTLVMLGLGAVGGFWFALGRSRKNG